MIDEQEPEMEIIDLDELGAIGAMNFLVSLEEMEEADVEVLE